MKRSISFFIFLLFTLPGFTQMLTRDWERQFPGVKINALKQAGNGLLAAAGESGNQGWMLLLDAGNAQVIREIRNAGAEPGSFHDVTQTFDGRFAAAGTAGKAALVIWFNDRGQKVQEQTFGGASGASEFRKLATANNGDLIAAGYREGRKGGDIWLVRLQGRKVVWETQAGNEEFETIAGLYADRDGGFVFCGNTGKKAPGGSGDVYIAKTDADGKLLWKKFYGDKGWEEALGVTPVPDGGYAIAGLTKSKGAGDNDFWLIKTSKDGARQWDKTFGGKNADMAYAVALASDNGFLLAGSSFSHRSGARTPMGLLVKANRAGELLWEHYEGSDKTDELHHLIRLFDGSYAAAGTSGGKAWLLRMSDPQAHDPLAGMRDVPALNVSEAVLQTPDMSIKPGGASWLAIQIENTSQIDLPDLRVNVSALTAQSGLRVWTTNHVGGVAKGDRITAVIPVECEAGAPELEHNLRIELTAGSKSVKSMDKTISVRKEKPATLSISDHQFVPSSASDEIELKIQLANSGDVPSGPVEVWFNCPAGIRPLGQVSQLLGAVAGHSKREVRFNFIKTPQFNDPQIRIVTIAVENGAEKVRKTLEWSAGTGRGIVAGGPIMIWTDPAPHETGSTRIRKTDDQFEFKMTVVTQQPVKTTNIKVKVNGVLMEGSKFNEEDLSPPSRENTYYTYTYRNKIPLVQGSNKVQVWVDGQLSDMLEVMFEPQRANLHLLCIGPTHEDLKYTAKDAADIAAAFQNQGGEGKLYNQVVTHLLAAPDKTDLTGIKQAFYDMAYLWSDKQIGPNDVLLVFISSHGKITENRFKVLQSGYNPRYERLAIDFKNDILDIIQPINCKKLIFIDACHSGGAKDGYGALSKAIADLARTQPGVSTLSSSSSTEKSYEDARWGNGAFTKAILEAFADQECTDSDGTFRADTDKDGIIRLGELYQFLRRRVPGLVKSTLPDAPTSQTPFMPENQLDAEMPIYLHRQ